MADQQQPKGSLNQAYQLSPSQESAPGADTGGYAAVEGELPKDSLFSEHQRKSGDSAPWWRGNFFVKDKVLFGTWDGVFTAVMVNIFGIIIFLRIGWIVGQAGIANSLLLLIICGSLSLIPVLSAIGICERCQIQSGGIYFLLSHILGSQIGGSVGLLYCFAQAVGNALVAVGFGESMAGVFGGTPDDIWLVRVNAVVVLLVLAAVNFAGVIWVIKLQVALVGILLLAVVDFAVGSIFKYDPAHGMVGFNATNFEMNTVANWTDGNTFFSVFGIFFSNFLGVLAGVNMSGDLKNPSESIPLGELSAIATSCGCIFVFIMVLGTTGLRSALLTDVMLAEKMSLTHVIFLTGMYVSSASSILSSIYGVPRVLQGIAADNLIPAIQPLERGMGPNKNPIAAMVTFNLLSLVFVLIGDLNSLAISCTIPFMITYAYVDYAYISLAMTFDLQQQRGIRPSGADEPSRAGYDSIKGKSGDLDRLFPERRQQLQGAVANRDADKQPIVDNIEDQTTADNPLDGPAALDKDYSDCEMEYCGLLDTSKYPSKRRLLSRLLKYSTPSIVSQRNSWYSVFCNRWVALIGMIVNLVIIFPMHFWWTVLYLLMFLAMYLYIGKSAPGAFPGITEFSLKHMGETLLSRCRGQPATAQDVVLQKTDPAVSTKDETMNDDNEDYAQRKKYHQSKTGQINSAADLQ